MCHVPFARSVCFRLHGSLFVVENAMANVLCVAVSDLSFRLRWFVDLCILIYCLLVSFSRYMFVSSC